MYKINVTQNNIHITDSYVFQTTKDIDSVLDSIRKEYTTEQCSVLKRSNKSLKREIRGHNLLYSLGLFKSHTKDVDLNYPTIWYHTLCWNILSPIYLMIKG